MERRPLTSDEVRDALADLPGWDGDATAISTTYRFADFPTAVSWIVRLGFVAEELDHHPELTNVYNRVGLRLTTHDADGVTAFDLELARRASDLATAMGGAQ